MKVFPEFFQNSKKREPVGERFGGREITPYEIDPRIRERARGWYNKYFPATGIPDYPFDIDEHERHFDFYEIDLEERILPMIDKLLERPDSSFSLESFEKILDRREVVNPWDIGNWLLEFELFIDRRDREFANGTISQEDLDEINSLIGEVALSQLWDKLRGDVSREEMEKRAELKTSPEFYHKAGHNEPSHQGY